MLGSYRLSLIPSHRQLSDEMPEMPSGVHRGVGPLDHQVYNLSGEPATTNRWRPLLSLDRLLLRVGPVGYATAACLRRNRRPDGLRLGVVGRLRPASGVCHAISNKRFSDQRRISEVRSSGCATALVLPRIQVGRTRHSGDCAPSSRCNGSRRSWLLADRRLEPLTALLI